MLGRGRVGNPQVLANLGGHHELRQLVAGKELTGAKGHARAARKVHGHAVLRANREVAGLVELVVGGDGSLGDNAQHPAVRESDCAVVELGVCADGCAEKHEGVDVGGPLGNDGNGLLGSVEKRVLPEEVFAGIRRHAELRKHDDARALLDGGIDLPQAGVHVVRHVGNANLGGPCRDLHESVLHLSLQGLPGDLADAGQGSSRLGQEARPYET